VEDSIDAGVHPAVAAMRRAVATSARTVEDAMTGRKAVHIIGQNRAPGLDMTKLSSDPSYNPMNFFKQATNHGVNPLRDLMHADKDGPALPDAKGSSSSKKKSGKKKKKKKDKKDKKKRKKDKKKKKNKKRSSSSSSSDSSSSTDDSSEPVAKKRKTSKEKSSSS